MASIDGFIIQEKIRESDVYDILLGTNAERQKRALKVAYSDKPNFKQRAQDLQKEYKTLQTINCENIVKVYNFKKSNDMAFMVMDYIESKSLRWFMQNDMDWVKSKRFILIKSIGNALHTLEKTSVVHRDLKPENIMVKESGEAILIDFSIATAPIKKVFSLGKGSTKGTRAYMSPEQIRNKSIDPRSDAYSYGALIYEILSGKPPFDGASPDDVLNKHLKAKPRPLKEVNKSISAKLDSMVMRLLAKKPDERYPMLSMFLKDLNPNIF